MRGKNVIAILLSDIHLSLKPPVWRSAEPDWFEAMARPLDEIKELQKEYPYCPILCAGDIFDKWNSSPEIINFALEHLPDGMFAIPGQHDLPLHNYEDIKRSAYWTLVEADKITNVTQDLINIASSELTLYGIPYGGRIDSATPHQSEFLQIAIVHDYVWITNYGYPGAPLENNVSALEKKLSGWDVVVFGDNHKGFLTYKIGQTTVFNCGTLMRRKLDEIDYKPQVGLLLDTGEVISHYLDISKDKYLDKVEGKVDPELDMTSFIEELEKLGETALDFRDAMKRFFRKGKITNEAKQVIIDAMEKKG